MNRVEQEMTKPLESADIWRIATQATYQLLTAGEALELVSTDRKLREEIAALKTLCRRSFDSGIQDAELRAALIRAVLGGEATP